VSELARSPGDPHRWTDLARNPDDERVPGIVVLRVEAGLFFANADYVRTGVRRAAAREGTRAVVLDAQTVAFIDVTAADMLATLSEELAALGVALVVAHDIGQVRDTLRETGLEDSIGSRTYATVDQAIEALTGPGASSAPAG
jgi:anti-anti-sigma factor